MKTKIFLIVFAITATACSRARAQIKDIVLLHGAFTDGSGWKNVCTIPKNRGYNVSIANHPNTGMAVDVAATQRVLEMHKRPVMLVGHSYAGSIITEVGNAPNVAGLVYVAALAPDEGESLKALLGKYPATEDQALSAPLQQYMSHRTEGRVSSIKGSHFIFISHAREVARIIEEAAKAASAN